jgi:hypothetical protein
MAGPWEQFAAPVANGPWTQFQAPQADVDNSTVGAPGTTYHGPYGNYTIPQPTQPDAPTAFERVGHGADRTVQGIHQAFLELKNAIAPSDRSAADLKDYTGSLNSQESDYQKGRGPNAGIDWASLAGGAGIAAPLALIPGAGAAGVMGRIGAGAVQGGIDAAAQPTSTGSMWDRAKNTAVGTGTGAVVAPVAGAVTDKLVGALSGIPGRLRGISARWNAQDNPLNVLNEVPEIATAPAEAQPALIKEGQAQVRSTGTLDAAALARKANLLANGLTPTSSMVTRDPAQWSIERNLQKLAGSPDTGLSATGQQLTRVYQGNDAALTAKAAELAKPYGAATQEGRGMTAISNLDDFAKASQKEVKAAYDSVRDAHGEDLASDARNVYSTLKNPDVADNAYAQPIIDSVTKRLKRIGMIDDEGNLTPKTMTVSGAEEFRKFVQTLKSGDPKTDRIADMFIKATDADVLTGTGENAFGGARQVAAQRFADLYNPATQKALNNIGELSQGKSAQTFIRSQIISAPEMDVASLLQTVGKMAPDKQQSTMNAIRGGVMEHLQDAAIKDNGQFSGAALKKAMDAIGPNKLSMVLGPDAHGKLQSLARAATDATYEPPYSSVNYSNTAPTLLSLMQKARTLPFSEMLIPEGAEKVAARSGYAGQLASALKAKAPAPEVGLSPAIQRRLSKLLSVGAAPAAATGINQLRDPGGQ